MFIAWNRETPKLRRSDMEANHAAPLGLMAFALDCYKHVAPTPCMRSLQFLVFEQQRCEFVQAAPPRLPLVRGVRRFVEDAVDAGFFKRRDVHFGIASETSAADAIGPEFTA